MRQLSHDITDYASLFRQKQAVKNKKKIIQDRIMDKMEFEVAEDPAGPRYTQSA